MTGAPAATGRLAATAALLWGLAGTACVVPGRGVGSAGGVGKGGSGKVTVLIGGHHEYVDVELRKKDACRLELERAGVAYSEAEFLLRVEYGDERAVRTFLRCGILGEAGDMLVKRRALERATVAGRAEMIQILVEAGCPRRAPERNGTQRNPP